jgi:hypothetical protein
MELVHTGALSEAEAISRVMSTVSLSDNVFLTAEAIPFAELLVKDKHWASEVLKVEPLVLRALNSKSDRLPHLALTALETTETFRPDLLPLIASESTGVADRASKLLIRFLTAELLTSQIDHSLKQLLANGSETVRVRVLALLIDAARRNPADLLPALKTLGYVENILLTFLTNDLLVKLNGAMLVEALGSFPEGSRLLAEDDRLLSALEMEIADPLDETSENSVLLVLANLGRTQNPLFWRKVENFISSPSRVLVGLRVLMALPPGHLRTREAALARPLLNSLDASNVEAVKAASECWSGLLGIWSFSLASEAVNKADRLLLSKPFPDVRTQLWRLLTEVISVFPAAESRKLVAKDTGVRKLLEDFKSEEDYEARRAKWGFVKKLVSVENVKIMFDDSPNLFDSLVLYAKEGLAFAPLVAKDVSVDQLVG